jgi:hypothetical protein
MPSRERLLAQRVPAIIFGVCCFGSNNKEGLKPFFLKQSHTCVMSGVYSVLHGWQIVLRWLLFLLWHFDRTHRLLPDDSDKNAKLFLKHFPKAGAVMLFKRLLTPCVTYPSQIYRLSLWDSVTTP